MKKYICLILGLFICQISIAQETRKNLDFIITVDEEIAETILKPAIIVKQGLNTLKKIEIEYHPGNLSFSTEDYNIISSRQDITLFFQFDYSQYSRSGKQKIYNYEIQIWDWWFRQTYFVLKIYNTSTGKYGRRLDPLSENQNYTFEYDTSSGQMIRIRKR